MALTDDIFNQKIERNVYQSVKRKALSTISPVCLNCPHRIEKTKIYDAEDLESLYTKYDFVVKFHCAKAGKKIIVKKPDPDFATYNTPAGSDEKPYMVPESVSIDTMEIPYCPDYLLDESRYASLNTGYKSGLPNDGGLLRLRDYPQTISISSVTKNTGGPFYSEKIDKSAVEDKLDSMLRAHGAFSVLLNNTSFGKKADYTNFNKLISEFKIDGSLAAAATELVFMDLMGEHDSGSSIDRSINNPSIYEPYASICLFFELRLICASLANLHSMSEQEFDSFIYGMPLEFARLDFVNALYGLLGLMCKLNRNLPPNWALERIKRTSDAYKIINTSNSQKIIHLYEDEMPSSVRGVIDNISMVKYQFPFLFYRQKLEANADDTDEGMVSVFS